MKHIFLALFVLLSFFAFSQTAEKDLKTPKGFILYLIQLSKDGNKAEWANVLSLDLKERYKDRKDYIDHHFGVWSPYFIELAEKYNDKFDKLVVECNESATTISIDGKNFMRVKKENGEFRINEN